MSIPPRIVTFRTKAPEIGLFFLVGLILFVLAAFWGVAKVTTFLLPIAKAAAGIGAAFFALVAVPLSIFKKLRASAMRQTLIVYTLLKINVWMMSFTAIWSWLGFWAIPAIFLFQFMPPLAIAGLVIKGKVTEAWWLLASFVASIGLKLYANWLAKDILGAKSTTAASQPDVIDISGELRE